jgi:hypothetical protein
MIKLSNAIKFTSLMTVMFLLFSLNANRVSSASSAQDEPTSTPTSTASPTLPFTPTSTSTPTFTPTPLTGLTLASTTYGCTSGPYITCSASVVTTHTDPYRWDFDITYTYGDNRTNMGSNFTYKIKFNTGVYYSGLPIWWNMYPITNEVMPNRKIDIYYSGVPDLASMDYPSGTWTVPGQPYPYNDFTVIFSRTTTAPEILVRTDKWHLTIATYPNVATPTNTPTSTPTATFTPTASRTFTPTLTQTPTNTPIPAWYTGNDRLDAYGVKALISAPSQAPYIENIPFSGQSNWVSIPAPYWIQAGWRYYLNWSGATPYVEWNMSNPPPGQNAYGIQQYDADLQSWGSSREYQVEWVSATTWCGKVGDFTPICKNLGVSPPIRVYAHSEVHASPLNELNTFFTGVYFKDSNNSWQLFDQGLWRIQSPYEVDTFYYWQFLNFGP